MFDRLHVDYYRYECSMLNSSLWAVLNYRFVGWTLTLASNMERDGAPIIGKDVYIGTGTGAVILGEVTIGDGARIAANSLVITDVPPGATAIGVPARVMKYTGRPAENN